MSQTALTSETEAIWREFHARLRAFVSRRVRRPADVEDILQEVFIRIHRGIAKIHDRERLPAWIFQITRNVIVDHFRAGDDRANIELDDYDQPAPESDGDADLRELAELSACMEPMVAALPENYREAIQLTELNGVTQVEASRRSGVSVSGMKSRVQRARRQLREMIEECCRVELDRRGGIVDYSVRDAGQSPCGPCKKSD